MSKLTRKYGKSMSAFAVATLAGITSMGMAQAQSPEVIMAPVPQFTQTEFGDVGNPDAQVTSFSQFDMNGVNWTIDDKLQEGFQEANTIYSYEYFSGILPYLQDKTDYIKYYSDGANSIKVTAKDSTTGEVLYGEEITQDFMNDHSMGGSGGFYVNLENKYWGNVSEAYYGSGPDGEIYFGLDEEDVDFEISADFVNSHYLGGSVGELSGDMKKVEVLNEGVLSELSADFVNTYGVSGGSGGFMIEPLVANYGLIKTLKGDYICNNGGGIYNEGEIGQITVNMIGNGSSVMSPTIANYYQMPNYTLAQITNFGYVDKGIINSNLINNVNYVRLSEEDVDGWDAFISGMNTGEYLDFRVRMLPAAVTTAFDLTIGAEDGATSTFQGNKSYIFGSEESLHDGEWYERGYDVKLDILHESNDAIFVVPDNPDEKLDLTLQAKTGGKLVMEDKIDGVNYNLKVTGDETGAVYLNNNVNAIKFDESNPSNIVSLDGGVVDVSLEKTNLILGRGADVLDGHNLTLNSGALSMLNDEVGQMSLNQLNVAGDTKFYGDVDLANAQMDRVTADEYAGDADIVVAGLNLLSDATTDTTEILFADYELKDNVRSEVTTTENNLFQSTYSPIFKYDVKYSEKEDGGYFEFSKHVNPSGGGTGTSDSFNPAVLGSSSTATVGATATMNQAFNYAFQHSADFMNIPYLERISMRDRNKYALSITGDATDMGRFSPLYQPSDEGASVWVKPYATFETVGLKNGPKVHNNTYGTLVGFDTEMQSIKRGWDRVFTGYIGYNGASQRYSGIDSTQNGGLLGGTMTLYKGNFFNATTVSVGASVANNQTMYGNEDFAMLLSGIGNKTGYNFEFKEGKLILQPSMLMSYTFVNTFDYTNAAGVRIDNKPLHALQLAPGVKVIGNLKNGWQPYASVQMVWNLMGESNATANGVKLPEMSIKPYVQYGVGVQKRIKDHFTAYGQAMIQNGGRNGISLTGGFRWTLGKNKDQKVEKVRNDKVSYTSGKKIIKQMTPEQRMALGGGKYMNTSRTAKAGSLRQY